MKGRKSFSVEEAAEIKRLLREKVRADRNEQKRIRGRIRKIGFYISDHETDQHGFSEADFDHLVAIGAVTVTGRARADQASDCRRLSPWPGHPLAAQTRSADGVRVAAAKPHRIHRVAIRPIAK